jgi:hypothetical protein
MLAMGPIVENYCLSPINIKCNYYTCHRFDGPSGHMYLSSHVRATESMARELSRCPIPL